MPPLHPQRPVPCHRETVISISPSVFQTFNYQRWSLWRNKFHGRLAELGARMEEKKETLTNLLQKDSDPVKIENLRKEMAAIQDDIQKEVITHIFESKKILDSKQQQRFFDLMRQSMTRAKN